MSYSGVPLTSSNRANSMPRWRDFNHFSAFLSVEFTDGTKWEEMSKVCNKICINVHYLNMLRSHQICVPVLRNTLGEDTSGRRLLRCTRAYVELDVLASLDVHSDITIEGGKEIARKFFKLADVGRVFYPSR